MTDYVRAGAKIVAIAVALLVAFWALSIYVGSRFELRQSTAPISAAAAVAPPVIVPEARAQVPTVQNPGALAQQRLGQQPGGQCQATAHVMLLPLVDLDARVAQAGGTGHWLQRDIWIGDIDSAVKAFEATWAARSTEDPSEAWIETTRDGRTMVMQLLAVKTTDGTEVWQAAGSSVVTPCDPNG
jgi:hypothetical protein